MAVSKTKKRFTGVTQNQQVRIETRRDDTRTFRQRLRDRTSTTAGTLSLFGGLALLSLLLSWAPFVPELLFLAALAIFFSNYRFARKRWSLSFRVPRYLSARRKREVLDATTGKPAQGNIFLGRCEETGREIWAHTDDLNKHSLLIGTTGSGKTEAIMGQLFGFLALNSGGLIVDGKASSTTFASAYKIARLFGRDADLLTMDYLTGGIDVAGRQKERRSHTYNPLAFGGPAQKSETMVSLLDGGDPMWSGRAMTFVENIIPPLSYLSDRGYIVLNPKLLGTFSVLEVVENLIHFGVFRDMHNQFVFLDRTPEHAADWTELSVRSSGIKTYLEGLPGYSIARPQMPHRTADMTPQEWAEIEDRFRGDEKGPPMEATGRTEVVKQHGFIQMQLTRSITNLAENYGFIYGAETGEIDYRDMVLNRRLLIVLLPALERSPENLKQLGRMTTLSLKAVLGSMLNTASEGRRREIIDGNPSTSKIPFLAVLDEVGAYKSPGLAVVPAQARSLGVSVCFGTQSIADLMKGDDKEREIMQAEGKAILDNTAVKFFGRLTSDEESDTAKTAIAMGGEAHVQVADQAQFRRGVAGLEAGLTFGASSALQTHKRIAYGDLTRQENGEFHIIVGTHDTDERGYSSGGTRVIRALAFYTGGVPDVEDWQRNPFCAVKPPSKASIKRFREAEIATRAMRDGLRVVLDHPGPKLLAAVAEAEKTTIGEFLAHRRALVSEGRWPREPEARADAIRQWVIERYAAAERARALQAHDRAASAWVSKLRQQIQYLGLDPLAAQVTSSLAAPWHARARDRISRGSSSNGAEQTRPPSGIPLGRDALERVTQGIVVGQSALPGNASARAIAEAVAGSAGMTPHVAGAATVGRPDETDFVLVAPFGTHEFRDGRHALNFLRYLFSLTDNHPTREETAFNMVSEWEPEEQGARLMQCYLNDSSNGRFQSLKRRRWAELRDPERVMDDGAYVSFIVRVGTRCYSNLVTAQRRSTGAEADRNRLAIKLIDETFYTDAFYAAGSSGGFETAVERAMGQADSIEPFESASLADREAVESKLHRTIQERMGGQVLLAVSHNDQPGHNPHYHIHRIRLRSPQEQATVSQDEIDRRNAETASYEEDRLHGKQQARERRPVA